jgi:O-antigen/teichoic acid export membrane protein
LIQLWAGSTIANSAKGIVVPVVLGSALMGLSVTGTYAMQALGLFRAVALISLGGRAAMLVLMIVLLHHMGLRGLAAARLCYGLFALIVYVPLLRELGGARKQATSAPRTAIPCELQEGSQS